MESLNVLSYNVVEISDKELVETNGGSWVDVFRRAIKVVDNAGRKVGKFIHDVIH